MNKIAYYANFTVLPVLVTVTLVINLAKALRFAVAATVAQTKIDYRSNKRYYRM